MAPRYLIAFDLGETVPTRIKCEFEAASAPTSSDTAAAGGWSKGSRWYVPSTNRMYVCEDETVATWTLVGGTDLTSLETNLTVTGAHTADRDDGATHDLTLTGNTTLTPDASTVVAGDAIDLRVIVRQDGVGSRTLAFGGTITWAGGSAPTMPSAANAVLTLGFLSLDDGTSWLGYEASGGSGGTAASTVESETSFGISAAVGTDTEYARQDHTHGSPANPVTAAAVAAVGYWAPLVDEGSGDLIRDEDSNEVIMAFVPTP